MAKSNLIVVNFRPQARVASLEELSSRLDAIDAALAATYARARQVEAEAESRARDREAARSW
jgi:hypothetical protein